jgi:hypothetical protein
VFDFVPDCVFDIIPESLLAFVGIPNEGEENWANLLRQWLPAGYQVVTKGRILGTDGTASSQVDVIVLRPFYPPGLIRSGKKQYLAAGVAAAFSCKLTTRAEGILEACEKSAEIKRLLPVREGSPIQELYAPMLFGFLAHSHHWNAPGSEPIENVFNNVTRGLKEKAGHPREALDIICIANLLSTRVYKVPDARVLTDSWHEVCANPLNGPGPISVHYRRPGSEMKSCPVATTICDILQMLGFENQDLGSLAEYLHQAGLGGTGTLNHDRIWLAEEVYTPKLRAMLPRRLRNGELAWNFLI